MFAPAWIRGKVAGVRRVAPRPAARVRPFLAVCVALLALGTLYAGPTLTLTDGRKLKGVDLRKDGEVFILVLANGAQLPVPVGAVKQLEWTSDEEGGGARKPARPTNVVTGRTEAETQEYEERAAARARENEAWLANVEAERAQRERSAQQQKRETGIPSDVAAQLPSVVIEPVQWQPSFADSTQGPGYWVPEPTQGDWLWGSPSQ